MDWSLPPYPRIGDRRDRRVRETIEGLAEMIRMFGPIPRRVQFLSSGELQGAVIPAGSAGVDFLFDQPVTNGTYIHGLLSDIDDFKRINIRDDWGSRYNGDEIFVPLSAFTNNPGFGTFQPKTFNRYALSYQTHRDVSHQLRDTQFQYRFRPTTNAENKVWFGLATTQPWENQVFIPQPGIFDPQLWVDYFTQAYLVEYRFPIQLDDVTTQGSAELTLFGDAMIFAAGYTGAPNIKAQISSSQESRWENALQNVPMRIDLFASCFGNPVNEFWPGLWYVEGGNQLKVNFESLIAPNVVDEELVILTYSWNMGGDQAPNYIPWWAKETDRLTPELDPFSIDLYRPGGRVNRIVEEFKARLAEDQANIRETTQALNDLAGSPLG